MASRYLALLCCSFPIEKAFSASSEEVVACSIGASYLSMVRSDSPSLSRSFEAAVPRDFSTVSLLSASTCSRAITSPLKGFMASSEIT